MADRAHESLLEPGSVSAGPFLVVPAVEPYISVLVLIRLIMHIFEAVFYSPNFYHGHVSLGVSMGRYYVLAEYTLLLHCTFPVHKPTVRPARPFPNAILN